ncbi:MAG TPA: dihydropteroate synthase [Lacibacter sp.]|nr:dihydropteroate synthase [Lacibacter sp.]HMO88988.1 dihydropteroate synthase [Lacibacter sp.]HMP86649.1 dihydropteroate synthase [Lacibacter sp.]
MYTLNCRGRLLALEQPVVMGILNITPDSFYSDSRVPKAAQWRAKAQQMIAEGAVILDVGGQSTRPGSERVPADEEAKRVVPSISALRQEFPDVFLSVDTYYAAVAKAAVEAGADLVNDVSAGKLDPAMLTTVAALGVPYIAMHMKGRPETMQQEARYSDVTQDVFEYLAKKVIECHEAGINDLVVDPGFGFAKTMEQNYRLLQQLDVFAALGVPLLAGLSRKSMIWKLLDTSPEAALNGSTVLHTIALLKGARILRVHDVREAVETVRLIHAVQQA